MRKLILRNFQSPGDLVVLTLVLALLHRAFPGQFLTDVRTSAPAIWENNPWITPLSESDPGVEIIDMHYPLIHQSNQRPYHFLHAFVQYLETRLNLTIPVTKFSGEIYLTDEEREFPLPGQELPDSYWIMMAGCKPDFTAKLWNPASYQRVVDHFRGVINFVQCGESGHWHQPLDGVTNLLGKTSLRQFVRLMHHAAGVVGPVTLAMHLAAAVETRPGRPKLRPCVVIAGGREPAAWEEYPGHQFLHTIGALTCCQDGGCWKSRCQLVGDGDEKDRRNVCEMPVQITPDLRVPRCMDMITPEDVIRRIEYYREGGMLFAEGQSSAGSPSAIGRATGTGLRTTPVATDSTKTPATNGEARHQPRPRPGRRPVQRNTVVRNTVPVPPVRSDRIDPHQLLLKFLHGLGDSVQATIVLQHLMHYHPDWQIDFAALYGKHSAAQELCRSVLVIDGNNRSIPGAQAAYHRTLTLEWDENREAHADWPSTKPIRCLRQVFQLTPILELCRYKIARSEEADRRARSYLEEICPERRSDGRFPVVLLHYQGNTSCDRKDLTHDQARQVCEAVRHAGQIPVILDWDNRSPLVDQQHVFNPSASHALWHNRGTGDAEILAALIEASSLMIGVDSGPLHVAGATTTPTLGVWTWHHPVHYFDLAPNVLHLVPRNHASLALGSAAVDFFERHYNHAVYTDLANDIAGHMCQRLEDRHSCPSGLGIAEFERSQELNDRAGFCSKDQELFARERHCFSEDSAAVAHPITIEIAHGDLDTSSRTSTGLTIPDRTSITAEPVAAITVSNFPTRTVVAETRTVNRRASASRPPLRAKAAARTPRPCCGGAKQSAAKREDSTVRNGHPPLTATGYNRQYYEEHKRTGLDYLTFGDWQRDYGRWFVESLNLRSRRVLDTGCACGAILLGLMEAGADGDGFDLSDYMIELGRRKWPHMASRLHVADAAELSRFQNASFDAIHSSQVAEHWPAESVPKILSELARITSPGGLFFCALDTEELFARQGRSGETEDPTHICIRPRSWWIEQLNANGWQDATSEYEHVLKSHPQSYLKRYDWDWFVGKKAKG